MLEPLTLLLMLYSLFRLALRLYTLSHLRKMARYDTCLMQGDKLLLGLQSS